MSQIAPLIVLAGNPNSGKSALFNALTGARQKIANYPGVTVERKSGHFAFADGRPAELVDLPGSYSLDPTSPDEEVTRSVIMGLQKGERRPDAIILVLDAANLDNHLRFALEVIALGQPVVVALNMMDLAERDGLTLDPARLEEALGVSVVPTVAVRRRGLEELSAAVESRLLHKPADIQPVVARERNHGLRKQAQRIADLAVVSETAGRRWSERADDLFLHPVAGPAILFAVLFVMFQAVFAWSEAPIGWIESASEWVAAAVETSMPQGFLRDFIIEGAIGGVGSVVVFLPQILILFLFILLLEASGYMTRAAFIMDRMMASVGLSGRSFIPLLASFA